MSNLAMKKYSEAKSSLRKRRGTNGDIVPMDNVMHSIWIGVDISMNEELISTTSQTFMYI